MSPDAQALIGQTFEGRYEILSKLGAGGMGTVYKARHLAMERDVAIKVLKHHLVHDEASRKRFVREMKATSRIDSPYTVSVHDYGTTESGDAFLVMEYLEGQTLKDLLRDKGALPLNRLLDITRQVASALGTAHEGGIIHRDIKPENIILVTKFDGSDWVKVLDFGIAQIGADNTQTTPDQLTATGTVLGTPSYMSPERARGHAFDHRADLYSLGILMFVMATGRPPYESTEPMGVLFKHITDPIPSLSDKGVTTLPDWLDDIIGALLAKSADDRPATAADFLARLEAAAAGAPPPPVPDAPTQILSTAEPPAPTESPASTAVLQTASETAKVDTVTPPEPPAKTSLGLTEGLFFLLIFGGLMALVSQQFTDPLHHARSAQEAPAPRVTRAAPPAPTESAPAPKEAAPAAAPAPVAEVASPKSDRIERRLVAVLFTDMVGFSRLMGADEAGSLALLRTHNELLKQAFADNGGRVVKKLGDGFMVEFSSSVEAVQAALAAQKALETHNTGKPEGQVVRVRMAIDAGDVVVEGEDLLGEVVNMASQLRRLAKPGTVAVTDAVRTDVRGKVRANGETLPGTTLKGHEEAITIHLLAPSATPLGAVATTPSPASAEAAAPSATPKADAEAQTKLREGHALLKHAPAQALKTAKAILQKHPNLGEAMLLSSLARTRLKQFGVAVTSLENCRKVQPDFVPCIYELARAYERLGNLPAAMRTYKEVAETYPGSTEAIDARRRLGR